ncbi:hypothetical protein HQN59_16645 [Schlegelella sp. ID0723]|uniref:Transposase TnpC homeodomain domain-containing protein n=1 Tax=Piscinibacter koreensis TaxID=2742824 RepID=A0A7Y6NQI2_9BURK|nr:hypothetical protein [Schlegelella koreensis]
MPQDAAPPPPPEDSAEALRLVVQARDAEIHMLKLLVQKLKLQVARRNRMLFGSASERFTEGVKSAQGTLLEGEVLDGHLAGRAQGRATSAPVSPAANSSAADRSLPAHLPREAHIHRPETTEAHRDAAGQACGCAECGGRLREIGRDVAEQLEYVPGRELPLDDRARPGDILLVLAVQHVVVDLARARVDRHRADDGIGCVAQQGRSPVGLVDAFVLAFDGQRVAEVRCEGRAPRPRKLPALAVVAHRRVRALGGVHVGAQHVAVARASAEAALHAGGELPLRACHGPAIGLVASHIRDLGDDVDRAADGTAAVQEARGAADGFHAVDDPGIHGPRRDGVVLDRDAVVQLGQARGAEAAIEGRARGTGLAGERDAGHGLVHVLGVERPHGVDGLAVDDGHAGRGLAKGDWQARGGGGPRVEFGRSGAGDLDALQCAFGRGSRVGAVALG